MANSASTTATAHEVEPNRRDFLYIASATVAAVGAVSVLVPLIDQMNPDASTLAAGGPVDVDVSKIAEGSQIVVRWRERPIWIYHRSKQTLDMLQNTKDISRLSDPNSEQMQQPPYAQNWHRSAKPEFGVLVGICTHLGCLPKSRFKPADAQLGSQWPGGFLCPCHGSRFDLAGRVFDGSPASVNLVIPPYAFASTGALVIGRNRA